ncbi:MAG: hypothetical protein SGILL_006624 [Bacillariaceae sp.]
MKRQRLRSLEDDDGSRPSPSKERGKLRNPFRNRNRQVRNAADFEESTTEQLHVYDDFDLPSATTFSVPTKKDRCFSLDAGKPRAASVPKRVSIMAADDEVSEMPNMLSTSSHHSNQAQERYAVRPAYAYPKIKMTRQELYKEMNRTSSYFHDLRRSSSPQGMHDAVGSLHFEILQCFGLPKKDVRKKLTPFGIVVCDQYAFKTDAMPVLANPMLLSKHRRACVLPIQKAYSRIYVGIFSKVDKNAAMDRFIGRIVLDVSRLRPGSQYDVTLPLRLSNQVYSRAKRGAVRCRFHLEWYSERAALMSYVPNGMPQFTPHDKITVRCSDNKAFQNVARTVHGHDLPGKFSMRLTKATTREINFVRVNVFRYLRKKEMRAISQYKYPIISGFVFVAWMHSVFVASLSYVPGHIVTLMLLYLWKNYTLLVLDQSYSNGFAPPFLEEMMGAVMGKSIEPLHMERKSQSEMLGESPDDDLDPQAITLQAVAKDLQENVPRIVRRRAGPNSFLAKDAVTFLVYMSYAASREEAVELCLRLQNELHLFQPARRRQQPAFKDGDVVFEFSNVETPASYVFTTHKPWFCFISRLLFSSDEVAGPDATDAHIEFPFATSKDHPRFTVKDGVPTGETARMLASMQDVGLFNNHAIEREESSDDDDSDYTDTDGDFADYDATEGDPNDSFEESAFADILKAGSGDSLGMESIFVDSSLQPLPRHRTKSSEDMLEGRVTLSEEAIPTVPADREVVVLPPPPIQDMDVIQKKDKTISEVLSNVASELHLRFGNLFHDKAYKIGTPLEAGNDVANDPVNKAGSKGQLMKKSSAVIASSLPQSQLPEKRNNDSESQKAELRMKRDQYDKLLRSGKYSNSNVILGKLGLIVQPLVDMAQTFLAFFRSSYNIFTWRDPFLTFWIAVTGVVLVPVLHIFPWRPVLGITGIIFVGPQNWALRKLREHTESAPTESLDIIVRKKRQNRGDGDGFDTNALVFSSIAPDNRPYQPDATFDQGDIKEVAVPQSKLLYRRCYDWPPEPEYARVTATRPPENNPEAARLLEGDLIDTYGATLLESSSDHTARDVAASSGGKRWARRMVNKGAAGVSRLRSGRKKDV